MARKCCVRNCDIDEKLQSFTGLPHYNIENDIILKKKWLNNCDIDNINEYNIDKFICHRHFKRTDYETIKGHKLYLKKNAIPSVFHDYDKHPDPIIMPVKTLNVNYNHQDVEGVKLKIPNLNRTESPSLNDSSGETCNSRPESSAGSVNQLESADDIDNESKHETSVEDETLNVIGTVIERIEYQQQQQQQQQQQNDNNNETLSSLIPSNNNIPSRIEYQQQQQQNDDNNETLSSSMIPNDNIPSNNNNDPNEEINNIDKEFTIKEELLDNNDFESFNNDVKPQPQNCSYNGLDFTPGAKLEAKDFSDKWYAARVVESDWTDREVLIHFEKWNSRYDEWIPMDSSRLRELRTDTKNEEPCVIPAPDNKKMREFAVGERILATWADGRKYPAKVNSVIGIDKYDVLFDDGYARIVKSSKMTKIADTTDKKETAMEPDTYIGSKQERRDKKRKHSVVDLFSRKKSKPETPDRPIKKEPIEVTEGVTTSEADNSGFYDSGAESFGVFDDSKTKIPIKSYRKKKESPSRPEIDPDDDYGPEWINGEPQGVESFTVDGNSGTRRSIIVQDKRLPPGWQKHFTQRKTGNSAGKWDVLFMHQVTGKKFRSRSDIRTFFESQPHSGIDPEVFDFCIHRKKRNIITKIKTEPSSPSTEPTKKIKTLLPKTKQQQSSPGPSSVSSTPATSTADNVLSTSATLMPSYSATATPVDDTAVYIGSLKIEMVDDSYKCPVEGCSKTVRKENLLQMHVKHYHPEYAKYLGSTPNVADLAYARTFGETHIDATPKSRFSDKRKSLLEKSASSLFLTSPSHIPGVSASASDAHSTDINGHVDDAGKKFEMLSPIRRFDADDDAKRLDASCAMSPGTLFDLKIKEEKIQQGGIKTLLPVRSSAAGIAETPKIDRSNSVDEAGNQVEKRRGQRRRQLSEYSSDTPSIKSKKPQGMQELRDEYGDLDDSALDAEGPAGPVYRFSRRKSDTKSDDNSQSSQLNDSQVKKFECPSKQNNYEINESEDGEGVMMMINGELVKVEQLKREEIINCTCGYTEEDGLMIQCDLCLCWQHGHCNGIEREKDVPEKYICYICSHPYRQRPSRKYIHDQDWIKEGKLVSLTKRKKDQDKINRRQAMLKRSFDLVGSLLKIQQMLHSLRVKVNIAQDKDHPKLYLWAKDWQVSEIPEPNLKPVPVMEIIKEQEKEEVSTDVQINNNNNIKEETTSVDEQLVIKDDADGKSISSDTELMKILEEDNTASNDSKDHILLDALSKMETNDKSINGGVVDSGGEENKSDHPSSSENQLTNENSILENKDFDNKTEIKLENLDVSAITPFIPEPEAPIDPAECRQRLLKHVDHFQNHLDALLTSVETQVCALEAMDAEDVPDTNTDSRTKETIQMLMRDLDSLRKLAALC